MKKYSRKQRLVCDINITPLTDVILVLLVIFMITTPLISRANLKVNLPTAKKGEPLVQTQSTITITNEGLVYLNEKLVTRKELRDNLTLLQKDNPNMSIILFSDKLVSFKEIVDVLDLLTELGISKLNIATLKNL